MLLLTSFPLTRTPLTVAAVLGLALGLWLALGVVDALGLIDGELDSDSPMLGLGDELARSHER